MKHDFSIYLLSLIHYICHQFPNYVYISVEEIFLIPIK